MLLRHDYYAKGGLVFMVLGLFLMLMSLFFDTTGFHFLLKDSIYVDGQITHYRITSKTIEQERVTIYYFRYTYNGQPYTGTSKSLGEYDLDETVDIEVLTNDPETSRLAGAVGHSNALVLGGAGVIVLVLGIVSIMTRWGEFARTLYILKDGSTIKGKHSESVNTYRRYGFNYIYKVYYSYAVNDKEYEIFLRTNKLEEINKVEKVIYSNRKHAKGIIRSQLPEALIKKLNL